MVFPDDTFDPMAHYDPNEEKRDGSVLAATCLLTPTYARIKVEETICGVSSMS
jgi:hypothetical protein